LIEVLDIFSRRYIQAHSMCFKATTTLVSSFAHPFSNFNIQLQ